MKSLVLVSIPPGVIEAFPPDGSNGNSGVTSSPVVWEWIKRVQGVLVGHHWLIAGNCECSESAKGEILPPGFLSIQVWFGPDIAGFNGTSKPVDSYAVIESFTHRFTGGSGLLLAQQVHVQRFLEKVLASPANAKLRKHELGTLADVFQLTLHELGAVVSMEPVFDRNVIVSAQKHVSVRSSDETLEKIRASFGQVRKTIGTLSEPSIVSTPAITVAG